MHEPDQSSNAPTPMRVEPVPDRIADRNPDDGWQLADPHPMGPGTRAAFQGLIRALCPAPPAPWSPEIASSVELGSRIFLRYMPPLLAHGFVLTIHLLDLSPLWTLRSTRRLRHWERGAAGEVLQALSRSRLKPVRLMVIAARAAVLSTYYDQDEVHEALDYHPMSFLQQRADLRKRLLDGLPTDDGDIIGPYSEVQR